MPAEMPAVELLPEPSSGRVYTDRRKVRLGDVDRRGRLRLDAVARYLQDIATDDATDAELDRRFGWLVRRTLVDTTSAGQLGEHVELATWCTGIGRSWAERRTSIVGDRGAKIDAVSLWVQIDVDTGRPARVVDDFRDAYGEVANGRSVSARLSLSSPSSGVESLDWRVRRVDLDPFDHVNNAATWAFLEEAAQLDDGDRLGRAELEYLQPITYAGAVTSSRSFRSDAILAWLSNGETVLSAGRWIPAGADVSGA